MADIPFPLAGKKVWIAGETGMVGLALKRALVPYNVELFSAPHSMLDLTDQRATFDWLAQNKPDCVFVAAARVGGIGANNSHPADFIRDNLSIAQNVIEGAHRCGVSKLLFLGSSCIYPKHAPQPIREEALFTGLLEETNEAYAIAKIAGLKLCQFYKKQYGSSFISVMPTNLYGPYDRFDAEHSHVIPAMMLKFHRAKMDGAEHVTLWGTGSPFREFLHADDLAASLIHVMMRYDGDVPLNIGSGEEVSIRALAVMMRDIIGYQGDIIFDDSKPDGTPRKFLDCTRIRSIGWHPRTELCAGLQETYDWYCESLSSQTRKTA